MTPPSIALRRRCQRSRPCICSARAHGEASPDSDVDLAVLAPKPLDPLARWELQETLAALLQADVDLVDLRSAPAVLKVQILDGGRLLLDRAPPTREAFEATALAMYARLNEERRGILDDIRARGHVHG